MTYFILITVCLTSCIVPTQKRYDDFTHKPSEMKKVNHYVFLRGCTISASFAGTKMPMYQNNKITFGANLEDEMRSTFITELTAQASKSHIKIIKTPNVNFLDVTIDEVYYDIKQKTAVIKMTICFKGERMVLETKHECVQKDFNHIFELAANLILNHIIKILK